MATNDETITPQVVEDINPEILEKSWRSYLKDRRKQTTNSSSTDKICK